MDYDLAVIGAGWAGFNSALKAKARGLRVALIEKGQIGGTCLNRGCIPTKTLIHSAKVYALAKRSATFGIKNTDPQVDFLYIQARKDKIIRQLQQGMKTLLSGIDLISGEARLLGANAVKAGEKELSAKFIIIAAGSKPLELKDIRFDGKKIVSSNDMLDLKEVPPSLLIIGGGVIGCEFASLFSSFGSRVTIVEMMPQLLPGIDKDVARKIEAAFKKKGIKVAASTDAKGLDFGQYEKVLLCVGRAPATENLGLEGSGIKSEKGRVITDEYLRTSMHNIYAAGDCASRTMLAHFAEYQGRIAAENIIEESGTLKKSDDSCVPACIFTDPEIGVVGLTEEEAKNRNMDIIVNRFDFLASGMARILEETDGFIKIISDKGNGELLGASIIGPRATELIGTLTLALQSRLKTSQIQDAILAHPTLSEGITGALKGYGA